MLTLPGVEPWFEIIKRSAMEQFDEKESLVAERFNALVYWLKHKTDKVSATAEISNYDAWQMIVRAVTKIEAVHPGSETPAITAFIERPRAATTLGHCEGPRPTAEKLSDKLGHGKQPGEARANFWPTWEPVGSANTFIVEGRSIDLPAGCRPGFPEMSLRSTGANPPASSHAERATGGAQCPARSPTPCPQRWSPGWRVNGSSPSTVHLDAQVPMRTSPSRRVMPFLPLVGEILLDVVQGGVEHARLPCGRSGMARTARMVVRGGPGGSLTGRARRRSTGDAQW